MGDSEMEKESPLNSEEEWDGSPEASEDESILKLEELVTDAFPNDLLIAVGNFPFSTEKLPKGLKAGLMDDQIEVPLLASRNSQQTLVFRIPAGTCAGPHTFRVVVEGARSNPKPLWVKDNKPKEEEEELSNGGRMSPKKTPRQPRACNVYRSRHPRFIKRGSNVAQVMSNITITPVPQTPPVEPGSGDTPAIHSVDFAVKHGVEVVTQMMQAAAMNYDASGGNGEQMMEEEL